MKFCPVLLFCLAVLPVNRLSAQTEQRLYPFNGVSLALEDVGPDAQVYFQSMRFNRALNLWNVEAYVTNKGAQILQAPLILSIESYTGTTGPLAADGSAGSPPRAYYDLS